MSLAFAVGQMSTPIEFEQNAAENPNPTTTPAPTLTKTSFPTVMPTGTLVPSKPGWEITNTTVSGNRTHVGGSVIYLITFSFNPPGTYKGSMVSISDQLDERLTIDKIALIGSTGSCSTVKQLITCTITQVSTGSNGVLVQGHINPTARVGQVIPNVAVLSTPSNYHLTTLPTLVTVLP